MNAMFGILGVILTITSIATIASFGSILVVLLINMRNKKRTIIKNLRLTKKDTTIMLISVIYMVSFALMPKHEQIRYSTYNYKAEIIDVAKKDDKVIITSQYLSECTKHIEYNTGYQFFDIMIPEILYNKTETAEPKYCIEKIQAEIAQ